ncbi:unnamed protein product [Cuscuta epithymum]|uniref:Uncharacterized protein n=1 Tax=Cuscuta epithymum TaxID=186058 RepID=A0AAV0C2I4_9ASTE|nr:unnamed protein product [Cuscuta epithymum]
MLEKNFGICPNSTMFFYGFYAMTSESKSSMEKKFAGFRSFGWSDSEIITMFQKQPFYFMNGLGCKMDFLSRRSVFTYGLEKRGNAQGCCPGYFEGEEAVCENRMCLYSFGLNRIKVRGVSVAI